MKRYESLKEKFNQNIFCKGGGGFLGKALGSLTGGLIGRDPNKEVKREMEKQREAEQRRIGEIEKKEKIEKDFSDKFMADSKTLEGASLQLQTTPLQKTNVDYTKSIKVDNEKEEDKPSQKTNVDYTKSIKVADEKEEDKLKKMFKR